MTQAGPTDELSPSILRHHKTSHEDTRTLERYMAEPYGGPVVLYRTGYVVLIRVREAKAAMTTINLLKAHGSKNDIFIIEQPRAESFTAAGLTAFVRRICDRSGPLGADGVYFLDTRGAPAIATFFNPDGSPAAFCGNGMRAVGRVLLDRCGMDAAIVRSDGADFTVRRAEPTPEGVAQIAVDLPPIDFAPDPPVVADGAVHLNEPIPELASTRRYTALAVPNSHLVSVGGGYDEAELVAIGERVAVDTRTFPMGANVSHVVPLGHGELFVRTYERGAGLTMSCGSGVVASRAVCSRLGMFAPDQPVVVRNPGGVSRAWLHDVNGEWLPCLEGNATFVYRAAIDSSPLAGQAGVPLDIEPYAGEAAAFEALDKRNLDALRAAGVTF